MGKKKEYTVSVEEAKRDSSKVETFIIENTGLVYKALGILHIYKDQFNYEDYYQIGMLNLYRAFLDYDVNRGVTFSTYAMPSIIGGIKKVFRDGYNDFIRIPRWAFTNRDLLKDDSLTDVEKAKKIGVKTSRVSALHGVREFEYLDALIHHGDRDDNNIYLRDMIESDSHVEDEIVEKLTYKDYLSKLTEKERQIIEGYTQDLTQIEIAEKLGISQVQVSRITAKILKKIRSGMLGKEICEAYSEGTNTKRVGSKSTKDRKKPTRHYHHHKKELPHESNNTSGEGAC
jgi:RNA polymerase sporulation-specific sigma factor